MMKKLMISTMLLLIIGNSNTVVYGNNAKAVSQESTVQEQSFKVNTPKVVSETDILLTLTAPQGTKVVIDVYNNTSVSKSKPNYVIAGDPIEIEIGALQRNWVEIELNKGLNKIDFKAVYEDGLEDVISRIIEVKDKNELKEQINNSNVSTSSTNALNNIANIEKNQ